jgi:hypothetical protein
MRSEASIDSEAANGAYLSLAEPASWRNPRQESDFSSIKDTTHVTGIQPVDNESVVQLSWPVLYTPRNDLITYTKHSHGPALPVASSGPGGMTLSELGPVFEKDRGSAIYSETYASNLGSSGSVSSASVPILAGHTGEQFFNRWIKLPDFPPEIEEAE